MTIYRVKFLNWEYYCDSDTAAVFLYLGEGIENVIYLTEFLYLFSLVVEELYTLGKCWKQLKKKLLKKHAQDN